jgi:hypothetical protein
MAHDPFLDAARQYCDADGHTCDPSVVFIGAMYGRRGAGGGRCSEALMRWWTDGTPAGGYSQALDGPVPDNYLVVDTSQTGATASLPDGGGATSWMDAWQGISRPDFFYFDPSLRLIDHLSGASLMGDYSSLASRTAPILQSIASTWTGCMAAGGTFCDEPAVPAAPAAPATAPCGDIDSSGEVDVTDLLILLSQFGSQDLSSGDTNYDGVIDVNDLLLLLSQFGGPC